MALSHRWTLVDAEAFLTSIRPVIEAAGFSARIVGSVSTLGESAKDLDILLEEGPDFETSDGYELIMTNLTDAGATWLGTSHLDGDEVDTWRLQDGRVLDIFFGEFEATY